MNSATYRILTYLFIGCGDAEVSAWVWRVSFISNFIATYVNIGYAITPTLADYYYLHMVNTVVMCIWWMLFTLVLLKSPGSVPEEVVAMNSGRLPVTDKTSIKGFHPHSYDAALVLMGSDLAVEEATAAKLPPVCHTCRVQKPLRSKHCKVKRTCICKFDHFW